ncbi:MAG: fructose-bisphosphate aldolase [Mycolicibacterium neoaurum]|uniref:glycoside hydrolase family 76 protein n=1 Tax=Mycolicibacterium neoaurum TaxID=1795 RepID=UPI002FFD0CC1
MVEVWANRAASSEAAITARHLRRLWGLPGTQLGVTAWPAARNQSLFDTWHYWWQAHLLDCLVDAQQRDPQPQRLTRIKRQIRGHHLRNNLRWTNSYYDDMAWLALALERCERLVGVGRPTALRTFTDQFLTAWVPEDGGGIPWRKQDQFFNAPANGPAGIFLARSEDRLRRAQQMADWIEDTLIDPETKLVFDGIKAGSLVRAQYTYCQGVVLGLEVELANRTGDPEHAERVHRLVAAVEQHMTTEGVIRGAGGGDGGLFNAITARYLALVASDLPGSTPADEQARATARTIVLTSAQSAWDYRQTVDGMPLFGPFWDRSAEVPRAATKAAQSVDGAVNASEMPERDLSVQLSGWMLMEVAHTLDAGTA